MKFSSTKTLCFSGSSNILLHNSKSISSQTSCLCTCTCTVHRHRYSSLLILRYIFHIKPHFSNFFYCEVISKRILIIFAPEEAEIFKDYLFILAWFSVRLLLFSYDLKTFFFLTSNLLYILTKIKSEKSTFVFKSLENKIHADKNYYQINK
jgi:hypothetical protein